MWDISCRMFSVVEPTHHMLDIVGPNVLNGNIIELNLFFPKITKAGDVFHSEGIKIVLRRSRESSRN